ncbi:MAG TPA: hypothetical protein VN452_06410 [Longilinea sp.]|nr:hypothetical protein [Longilinea sp.]
MKGKLIQVFLIAILLFTITACLPGKAVKGTAQEAVLNYTEPIADNILNGIEGKDYALFSQDFTDTMKKGIDEASFTQLCDLLSSKVGTYQSRQVSSVRDVDGMLLVIYTAVFSNAKQVVINLSISPDEPHLVTGLYFNSPELRK